MELKRDIENREDLHNVLSLFYQNLLADPSIGYIFTDVAKIDMEHHLPVITDFWETVLFHTGSYEKNAIVPHLVLNSKTPLLKSHFDTWLMHFGNAVDLLFEGERSIQIKQHATSIATIMQIKIRQTN